MTTRITSYCRITNRFIYVNNALLHSNEDLAFADFAKQAYKLATLNYLKFFKMDNLSKLGLLAAEFTLAGKNWQERYTPNEVALCFSNASSSIDSDRKHQESIGDRSNYFPSPSVFVYTLPNILAGEICIRNGFKGENSFFIFEQFDAENMVNIVQQLFINEQCKACVMGWINYDSEQADALCCLIEKSDNEKELPFTAENYSYLYFNTKPQ